MSTPFLKTKKRGQKPTPVPKDSLGGKIRAARLRLGLSTRELGKLASVSNVTITHIETGQTTPPLKTLRVLAQELQDSFGIPELARYVRQVAHEIRVVAYVAGGKPIVEEINDQIVTVDPSTINITGDVTALRVKGDSMVDQHILNGDILICRKNAEPRKGQISVVDLKGERGAAVKRWQRKGNMIYLYADKNAKDDEKQAFHDWEVGKVFELLGLIRSMK